MAAPAALRKDVLRGAKQQGLSLRPDALRCAVDFVGAQAEEGWDRADTLAPYPISRSGNAITQSSSHVTNSLIYFYNRLRIELITSNYLKHSKTESKLPKMMWNPSGA